MLIHNDLGSFVDVTRPAVISESLPGVEHLLLGGSCQTCNARKAFEPVFKIWQGRIHPGLLEHDL